LGAVGKVAELRFPEHQGFRVVAAETIFEAEAACFGERGIVNFAKGLIGRKMTEWKVVFLCFGINQNGVALIERTALRVLAGEPDRRAFEKQGAKGQRLGETVIDRAFVCSSSYSLRTVSTIPVASMPVASA